MLFGDERHTTVDGEGGISTGNRTLNFYWAAKLLRPARKAERMQPVNNASVFARRNRNIQRAGRGINDRCAADADFRRNQSIGRFCDRGDSGGRIDKAALPEWRG